MKRIFSTVVFLTLIIPFVISNDVTAVQENDAPVTKNIIQELPVGAVAPDFNVSDVDTNEHYVLSELLAAGRTVFIDTFATWCGPCIASLPFLKEIYEYYPQDVVTMISIDESGSDTLELVQEFRDNEGMEWIVSFNDSGTVLNDFGVSGIPTFFVVKPDGRVAWSQVGYADEYKQIFLDELKDGVFPPDTVDPIVTSAVIFPGTELSIFYPDVTVVANISDDRDTLSASLTMVNPVTSKRAYYDLTLSDKGDYKSINQVVGLDPLVLYGADTVDLYINGSDYYANVGSYKISLSVTEYEDAGAPVIESYTYTVTEIDEKKYEIEVYVEVTEDLLIAEGFFHLYIEDTLKKTFDLEIFNSTHMKGLAQNLFYLDAEPTDYTIKLQIYDAAGNVAEQDIPITNEASFGTVGLIISAIIVIGFAYRIRRKR